MSELSKFLERAEALVARLEVLLPAVQPPVDWNASIRARREAHLARGTSWQQMHGKRSSNGGTG